MRDLTACKQKTPRQSVTLRRLRNCTVTNHNYQTIILSAYRFIVGILGGPNQTVKLVHND